MVGLTFYTYPGEELGQVHLVDGVATPDAAVAHLLVAAWEPGTKQKLSAADGERYLRALVHEFRSGYLWAVLDGAEVSVEYAPQRSD